MNTETKAKVGLVLLLLGPVLFVGSGMLIDFPDSALVCVNHSAEETSYYDNTEQMTSGDADQFCQMQGYDTGVVVDKQSQKQPVVPLLGVFAGVVSFICGMHIYPDEADDRDADDVYEDMLEDTGGTVVQDDHRGKVVHFDEHCDFSDCPACSDGEFNEDRDGDEEAEPEPPTVGELLEHGVDDYLDNSDEAGDEQ